MAIRCNDDDSASVAYNNSALLRQSPFSAMFWANNYSGGVDPGGGGNYFDMWGASGNRCWRISASDGPLEYRARVSFNGADQESVSSNTTIALDTWFHVGMDFNDIDINFYLNGVIDASSNQPGTLFASTLDIGIGGDGDGGGEPDMSIEDARYYDRLLSAAEWQTIFASRGKDGIIFGLVAEWQLNDASFGSLVTAQNPKDIGPNNFQLANAFGAPVPNYIEGPGLDLR